MKRKKIQPVLITNAIVSNNGQFIIDHCDQNLYIDYRGNILGTVDVWDAMYSDDHLPRVKFTTPLYLKQRRNGKYRAGNWRIVAKYRAYENFDRFRPETGANGGDYGYWVTCYVFARQKYNRRANPYTMELEFGYINCCSTTADFAYSDDGMYTETISTEIATNVDGGFNFQFSAHKIEEKFIPLEKFEEFHYLNDISELAKPQGGLVAPTRREWASFFLKAGIPLSNHYAAKKRREKLETRNPRR